MYHCSSVKESKFFNKNEKWVELMNGLLNAIRYQLSCVSLDELCDFAARDIAVVKNSEPVFQDTDISNNSIFKKHKWVSYESFVHQFCCNVALQNPFITSLKNVRPSDI